MALHCGEGLRVLAGRHDADEDSSLDRWWILREDRVMERICAMKLHVVALLLQSAVFKRLRVWKKVGCRRTGLLLKLNEVATDATKGRLGSCADFCSDGAVRNDRARSNQLSLECQG